MRIKMAGATDIGRTRKANQDSFYYDATQGIVIVADGIGGRKGGEIASRLAVEGMRDTFLEAECLRHEEINPFLTSTVDKVNNNILSFGERDIAVRGMGTTLNFLMFVGDRLHIAHVGDSRTYLYYKGEMWLLTLDHNIETYLERGWMSPDAISPGTKEGALVRSVGLAGRCEVDIYDIKLREGEIFLTCSDGLTGMVTDKRIAEIITEYENSLSKLPKKLIDEANRNGGRDNTTVVITQVKGV